MAIIPQLRLFLWDEMEELGDLERLRLVLENMPDEAFMKKLEKERGKGRDDYPLGSGSQKIKLDLSFTVNGISCFPPITYYGIVSI